MNRYLKHLFAIYLSALFVLIASIGTSLVIQQRATAQLAEDASNINKSGRQRMLSQRIIYLAQNLAQTPDPVTRTQLEEAIGEFEAAINLFEGSHSRLSGADNLSPELGELYFGGPNATTLDARIRAYIRVARAVAASPTDTANLERLRSIEQRGLLADINAVVAQYERDSIARISQLETFEWAALMLALGIVIVEICFVFRPGHRFIENALTRLSERNQQLDAARKSLRQEQDALRASLEESEQLRKSQAEFIYGVSHDLKSPTNSLTMFLSEIELTNGAQLDADGKGLLALSQNTLTRMSDQIEDIISYCGAEEAVTVPEPILLASLVEEVMADMADRISDAQATIRLGALHKLGGHRAQIKLLIAHLLGNALKYRDPDRALTITISSEPWDDGRSVKLHVEDTGIGIAKENQERIFKLFERLHLRHEYSGSGLGLCTCQRIARHHNGILTVHSEEGKGTRFTATLSHLTHDTNQLARAA